MKSTPVLLCCLLFPVMALAHPHGHGHDHGHGHSHGHGLEPRPDGDAQEDQAFGPEASWARVLLRPLPQTSSHELLRVRALEAEVVAFGRITEKRVMDEGRLYVAKLDLEQVYRGEVPESSMSLVDYRGSRSEPEYMELGARVFMVLDPTPSHSYLRDQLDEGPHFSPARALNAPLILEDTDSAQALADWLELADSPTTDFSRAIALDLLAQGEARLSRMALAELSRVSNPGALTDSERALVERVMDNSLPGKGELALRLADWEVDGAREVLAATASDDPVTRARVELARYALGSSPDLEWAMEAVLDDQPEARAAAARLLGLVGDGKARETVAGRALSDENADVRIVALYSLAQSGDERAHDVLRAALDAPAQSVRFQAGRALRYLDTEPLAEVLRDTIREGEHRQAREYAAKLLVFYLGRDHGTVAALRHNMDEGEVRRILTEGAVDRSRVHSHDVHEH